MAYGAPMGKVTLLQRLKEERGVDAACALGCSPAWISKLLHRQKRPSEAFLARAQLVWPELDLQASREEFMDPVELAAARGERLARLVLACDPAADGVIRLDAAFAQTMTRQALSVIEALHG